MKLLKNRSSTTRAISPKNTKNAHDTSGNAVTSHAANPRALACALVQTVLSNNTGTQAALDAVFSKRALPSSDKGLCTELTYGSLRKYVRLHWFLRRFLTKPDALPPEMLICLSVALYELFFTRVPAYATINSYVDLVRQRFGEPLSRVANGVLRNCDRAQEAFVDPKTYSQEFSQPTERMAYLHAMPCWVVDLWLSTYGPTATELLLNASGEAAPSALRLNKKNASYGALYEELTALSLDVSASISPLCLQHGATLAFNGPLPTQAQAALRFGQASQQSAASQEVLFALDPATWPGPVWDACAGRGGKTLALLEMGVPVVLASDVAQGRLRGLENELTHLALPRTTHVRALSADKVAPDDLKFLPELALGAANTFGTVLIDAPCTGLGTLSRHPEIRLRRTPGDVAHLAALQSRILENLSHFVMPDGLLVYITCTLSPAENDSQVKQFLENHPQYALESSFQTPFHSPLREFFWAVRLRKRS